MCTPIISDALSSTPIKRRARSPTAEQTSAHTIEPASESPNAWLRFTPSVRQHVTIETQAIHEELIKMETKYGAIRAHLQGLVKINARKQETIEQQRDMIVDMEQQVKVGDRLSSLCTFCPVTNNHSIKSRVLYSKSMTKTNTQMCMRSLFATSVSAC